MFRRSDTQKRLRLLGVRVHKWTSLICTVFLLMLCITGLPLIFHHEIDDLLHDQVEPAECRPARRQANLDRVLAAGWRSEPGKVARIS